VRRATERPDVDAEEDGGHRVDSSVRRVVCAERPGEGWHGCLEASRTLVE
jgi:hypothetical protein